ncbi:TetR/AcrR family transcriptional regulator [Variovorax robiniae]|uniref:TetR/AcrR family transcriptional regulator n=1 Tax=Variovorax robiniae TaxID=1836199 RepID=A0ABU8XCQ6_9BURK
MTRKAIPEPAPIARRNPQQARAQLKVELILEAAMRLLDKGDLQALTTNAVAEKAGVSIGTLYQYFDDKAAILDALAQKEVDELAAKALASLTGLEPAGGPGERIRRVMRAVLGAYGGRPRVHRLLLEYGLGRGRTSRLNPLYESISSLLAAGGVQGPGGKLRPMGPADAFVLTYAISGVLRAYVAREEEPAGRKDVEDALVRLALRFVGIEEEGGAARSADVPAPPVRQKKSAAGSAAGAGKAQR